MPKHRDILNFLEALGYEETNHGHCRGISNIILQSFFVEDGIDACLERLNKIDTILRSARIISSSDENFLKNLKDKVDALPHEEKYDLYAFFDSIKIVQSPKKYIQYFSKKKIRQSDILDTLTLVLSEKLEKENKTLNVHPNESGIYNQEELEAYLKSLREALDVSTSRSPTLVNISKFSSYAKAGHATGFAYDPIKKLWYFVDSNSLPPKMIQASNEKQLVKAIFKAYSFETWKAPVGRGKKNDFDYIAIKISIRNVASSSEEVANQRQLIDNWRRSPTYQRLHEPTPERINKKDKHGVFWLDTMESEVKKTLLSKRSIKSFFKASLKKLSTPKLIVNSLLGSLSAASLLTGFIMTAGGALSLISLEAMALLLVYAAIFFPVGIGLMIGIPLLAIAVEFFIFFIYEKIAGCFSQPTIQNQDVNEMTRQEIHPKKDNGTKQIVTLLKENTLNDNAPNNECILEEKDSKADQSLLEKKEDLILKTSIENDNLLESNLPLNMMR